MTRLQLADVTCHKGVRTSKPVNEEPQILLVSAVGAAVQLLALASVMHASGHKERCLRLGDQKLS